MRVEAGVATDIGRVRERNEDSYLVEPPLFAVADGMGGHRGGAVASELALEKVDELSRTGTVSLPELVRAANRAVFERSMSDRAVAGMGTTLTAATVDQAGIHLAHVGDSRAYLLRAAALRQLTEDHTLVNRMVKAGEITRDEAEVHPHRNVLSRVVGTEPDVDVDVEDIPVLDGDRVLICSDGLTNMVTELQIQAILEATPGSQETADRLIKAANRAGGIDNITVLILDVHDEPGDAEAAVARPVDRASRATAKRVALRAGIVLVAIVAAVPTTSSASYALPGRILELAVKVR
jgi:protein phosphatase